jgi:hypothetical protein
MKLVAKTMNKPKLQDKSCCIIEGTLLSTEVVEGRITTIAAAETEYRIVSRRLQRVNNFINQQT